MVEIGKYNSLKIVKRSEFGIFLDGGDDGEILLPRRHVPAQYEIGESIRVFICYDSEDRLVATTETPLGTVGEFALLKVVAVESVGAFLHWGLSKDLFLPFAEQTRPLRMGQDVLVFIYLDKSSRISASMRLDRYLSKEGHNFQPEQSVSLIVADKTDLGYRALIDGRHIGILYYNEVFQDLQLGQKLTGYIKNLRPDGKIDLSLTRTGHQGADDIGPKIMALLEQKGGFLAINDKTSAETIYSLFGASKKKYKIALGGLYKKRLITVSEEGIRLTAKAQQKV